VNPTPTVAAAADQTLCMALLLLRLLSLVQ
jgi:hypothetical protein